MSEEKKTPASAWIGLVVVVLAGAGWAMLSGVGAKFEASCRLNGLGDGECEFSNRGWGAGDKCVQVGVRRKDDNRRNGVTACSDRTWPGTTTTRKVLVPDADKLCMPSIPTQTWKDVCVITVE